MKRYSTLMSGVSARLARGARAAVWGAALALWVACGCDRGSPPAAGSKPPTPAAALSGAELEQAIADVERRIAERPAPELSLECGRLRMRLLAEAPPGDEWLTTLARAIDEFEKAAEAPGPTAAAAQYELSVALWTNNQREEALAAVQRARAAAPDNPLYEAHEAYCAAALSGDWKAARDKLERLAERFSDAQRADGLRLLGTVRLQTGDRQGGEQSFRRALELAPEDPRPRALLAQLLFRAGKREEALDVLWKGPPSRLACNLTVTLASQLLGERRAAEARDLLERAREHFADSFSGWSVYGEALFAVGENDAAVQALQTALQKEPANSRAPLRLAGALRARGQVRAARDVVRAAARQHKRSVRVQWALADAYRETGEYDAAERALRKALTIQPNDPGTLADLAALLEELGRFPEALELRRAVLQRRPNRPESHMALAECHAKAGAHKEALSTLDAAAKRWPKHAGLQIARGHVLSRAGESDDALAAWSVAASLDRSGAEAHGLIAAERFRRGEYEEALRSYRKALAADASYAEAVHGLVRCHLRLGNGEDALRELDEMAGAWPARSVGFARVHVLRSLGRRAEAVAAAQSIAADAPLVYDRVLLGWLHADAGNVEAALSELERARRDAAEADSALPALAAWCVLRSAGQAEAADRALRDALEAFGPARWDGKLLRHFSGELTAEALLAAAHRADERMEAAFYVGERLRLLDGPGAARPWFERCTQERLLNHLEHALAEWRLGELESAG